MKVVTSEQMRALDRRASEEFGIPGVVLMENAGRAVVETMEREYSSLRHRRTVVFCGAGNNGGDGFVIARYLKLAGADVRLALLDSLEKLKPEARTHYDVITRLDLQITSLAAPSESSLQNDPGETSVPFYEQRLDQTLSSLCAECDLIVDALLGTGIKDAPRSLYARAIEAMNRSGKPIIAVDVPSGMNSDNGKTPGATVRASLTVTFAYPKLGMFLAPGCEYVGKLEVKEIGFDWPALNAETGVRLIALPTSEATSTGDVERKSGTKAVSIYPETATTLLKRRPREANKGMYGHVGILAGSAGMAGAVALAARAAQRSGAGLVTVLTPKSVQPTVAGKLDEQMTIPLPDEDGAVSKEAFDTIAAFAEKATLFCIGPGLTTKPGVVALITRLLAEINKPIVLDADGPNILARNPDCLANRRHDDFGPLVLTPHPGEAARLLGTTIADVQSDRVGSVRELARRYGAIALLKGRFTLISDPEGKVIVNTSGNPGMATGGSGDILTGIVGAMLAQSFASEKYVSDSEISMPAVKPTAVKPEDAVALAAYLHGLAADIAAEQNGELGMISGDILLYLQQALRQLEGSI